MRICIFYTSPKLGDIILQLPFIKAISDHYKTRVTICINKHINIKKILESQNYIDTVIENPFRRGKFFILDIMHLTKNPNPMDKTPKSCNMLEAAVPKLALTAGVLKNETNQAKITEKGSPKTSKYPLRKLDIISNQAIRPAGRRTRGPKAIILFKCGL